MGRCFLWASRMETRPTRENLEKSLEPLCDQKFEIPPELIFNQLLLSKAIIWSETEQLQLV